MYHYFFSLGSNLGNKQKNIENAYKKIEKRIGKIVSKSAFYITEPEGFQSENLFVNSVCEAISDLNIDTVFAITKSIEKEIGRSKKSVNEFYADRIIDIDLLLAGNRVINTPSLIVPHIRLHTRKFVLQPLAEIAPDVVHPILKKTMIALLNELSESP